MYLYIDYLSPKGHIGFNRVQIESLMNIKCELFFVLREGYAKELCIKSRNLIEIPNCYYKKGIMPWFINYIRILYYTKKKCEGKEWKSVIFSSYETLSLSMLSIFKGAYIINHNNISDLDKLRKKLFFLRLSRFYNHIVFNNNMFEKLNSYNIRNVYIIPHGFIPIPKYAHSNVLSNYDLKKKKYIFFPGKTNGTASNTKNIINKLFVSHCKNRELSIVNRFENGNNEVVTIKGFLSNNDYYTLLKNCLVSILCYDYKFRYRVSGILFECMALNIPVLIYDNDSFELYNNYVNSGKILFTGVEELNNMIDQIIINNEKPYYCNLSELSNPGKAWEEILKY